MSAPASPSDLAEITEVACLEHVPRVPGSESLDTLAPVPPAAAATVTTRAIEELLLRMRAGDREAAAEFFARYGSRLRRRIRGKLGPSMRRLFDSMDILSTIGRRLDLYVMSGRLSVSDEVQMWSLLMKIADRALIDKARIFRRLQSAEAHDSDFAHAFRRRLQHAELHQTVEIEVETCILRLKDPLDRKILSLWLVGERYGEIAEHVDLEVDAIRKRWERIKAELRSWFEKDAA